VEAADGETGGTNIRHRSLSGTGHPVSFAFPGHRMLLIPHDNIKAGSCGPNRFGFLRKLPAALEGNVARTGTGSPGLVHDCGLPVGVFGGREEVMREPKPRLVHEYVHHMMYISGTFEGG
jgi:hypothetical protein